MDFDGGDILDLYGGDDSAARNQASMLAQAIRQRRAAGMLGMITGDPAMASVGKEFMGSADQMQGALLGAAQHRAQQDIQRQHLAVQEQQLRAMNEYRDAMLGIRGDALNLGREKMARPHIAVNPNTGETYNTNPGSAGGSVLPRATGRATAPGPGPAAPAGPRPFSGKMLDKMLKDMGADFDPNGGRSGEVGKNQARVNAATRMLALAEDPQGNPVDLNPQQMAEFSQSLASLLSNGGTGAQAQIEHLLPKSFTRDAAGVMQYLTSEPHGAGQIGFVKNMIETAKRERDVASKAIEAAQQQRSAKHQVVIRANPNEARRVLNGYGFDIGADGSVVPKQAPASAASANPQDAAAKAWATAHPGDPRAAKILERLKAKGL